MRIIRLQAEGFKRLVAVDITPDGNLVEIRGNNGEGKSSVLDAIFAALAGKDAAPVKPVKSGEEYAIIKLDLGDLRVTRYFGDDGATTLKVENADGAVYSKGQTMLDALVGSISFDPLAFRDMDPKDQAAEIRRLVKLDVDLDELAAKDKEDYDNRRDVNREANALKARIEGIVLPAMLPTKAPDKDAIVAELAGAADINGKIEAERFRRRTIEEAGTAVRTSAQRKRDRAEELRSEAAELDVQADRLDAERDKVEAELKALPPLDEPVDTAEVQRRLAEAERDIAVLARKDERDRLAKEFEALKAKSDALSKAMSDRNDMREKALAAAEMPVDGLGFATINDDLLVTFNGEPFSQASGAEQLRVSTAIAMAANPKLRVLRIKDGSLLDKNGLKLLSDMATANDFQIWGEFVGDEGAGIIMEAGAVKGAAEPERVEPPKRRKKKDEGGEETAEEAKAPVSVYDEEGARAASEAKREEPAKRKPQAMREFTTPTPTPDDGKLL